MHKKKTDYSYLNFENKHSKTIYNLFKSRKLKSKLVSIYKQDCDSLLKKINNNYFKSVGKIENLAFAYKIAKNFNINDKIISKAVNEFKGLPHRQEVIFSNNRITFVNDSKATSFDASAQSLLSFNKIYWIVGGLPKNQDIFNLRKYSKKIIKAYIIGQNISFFKKQIGKNIPFKVSRNLRNAIKDILSDVKKSKNFKNTILLSPAAASFDQFNSFEERGDYFKSLVMKKNNEISHV